MADITGASIVSSVRGLLDDDQYDEDLIIEAANWFVYELYNDTRTRRMETSDELSPGAGDTEVEMPEDIQTILGVSVISPQVYDIWKSYVPYDTFKQLYPNYASAAASQLREWTQFGENMRFSAPLLADTTISFDYLREPVPMDTADDDCEVKTRYAELVSRGTLARLMEVNEDYAEAAQERRNLAPLITTFKRNEGRGLARTGPIVIRTNRRAGGSSRGGYTQADF